MCHCTFIQTLECVTPRVNRVVNFEHWMIITCQGKFISCNKCTIQVGDVDNKLCYVCVGARVYEKSLYLPLNSAMNLKLLLKIVWKFSIWFFQVFADTFYLSIWFKCAYNCCCILWCCFKILLRQVYYLCHFKVGICFWFCFVFFSLNLRFSWFLQWGEEGDKNYLLQNRTVRPAFPLSLCWHLVERFFSWFLRARAGINAA